MKITLKSALLIGAVILSTAAMSQQKAKKRTAYVQTGSTEYGNNTYTYNDEGGVLHEYVETNWEGDKYEMKLVGGKPIMLIVNGEKIAPAGRRRYFGLPLSLSSVLSSSGRPCSISLPAVW